MNRLGLVLLIAASLASTTLEAAEWTHTLDLTDRGLISLGTPKRAVAEGNLFWLDSHVAVDAVTGALRDPRSLPEFQQLDTDIPALISSRRGMLWHRNDSALDGNMVIDGDAQLNGWGLDSSGLLVRVARDGAQLTRFSAGDIGSPGYHFQTGALAAQKQRDGVWVLLTADDSSGDRVVQLDGQARVLRQFDNPLCGADLLDDRNGGVFVSCVQGTSASVRRVPAAPAAQWTSAVSYDPAVTRLHATPAGGLLLESIGSSVNTYRYVSADGQLLLNVRGHYVALYQDGLWIWSGLDGQLSHYRRDGSLKARIASEQPYDLTAGSQGHLLLRTDRGFNYSVLDADARLIRSDEADWPVADTVSRLDFNAGQPLAQAIESYDATLVDDEGRPTSSAFPVVIEGLPGLFWRAKADARTLCYEYKRSRPPATLGTPLVRCQDRASGAPLGMDKHFTMHGEMHAVGPNVWIKTEDAMIVHAPQGAELASIDLRSAIDQHSPDARGMVVAYRAAGGTRVVRHGAAGEVVFDQLLAGNDEGTRVFAADDGSTVVYRRFIDGPRIDLLGAHGDIVGTTRPRDWPAQHDVVSAAASADGVMLLLQTELADYRMRSNTVFAYSRDLETRRGHHALSSSWRGHGQFWPSDDGDPRVALGNYYGLSLYRFDAQTGQVADRHVLPIADGSWLTPNYNKQYGVRRDGSLQMFHRRVGEYRDVLHVFDPDTATPTTPLLQPALAGAWNTPSSSGQGLVFAVDAERRSLFAAWHTFEATGGNSLAQQRWFTLQGLLPAGPSEARVPIYRNRNGGFDEIGRTEATPVGEAELVLTQCDHMELWFRIGDEHGAIPLQRSGPRTRDCQAGATLQPAQDAAGSVDLDGLWFDPERSGQGFAFASGGQSTPVAFGGWFTYDVAGGADDDDAQHWFTVQGGKPASYGEAVTLGIFRTTGGSRGGKATRNTHRIGSAQLVVHDCARATLEYDFDDSAVAGAFANRTRSVPLVRLGNCND